MHFDQRPLSSIDLTKYKKYDVLINVLNNLTNRFGDFSLNKNFYNCTFARDHLSNSYSNWTKLFNSIIKYKKLNQQLAISSTKVNKFNYYNIYDNFLCLGYEDYIKINKCEYKIFVNEVFFETNNGLDFNNPETNKIIDFLDKNMEDYQYKDFFGTLNEIGVKFIPNEKVKSRLLFI